MAALTEVRVIELVEERVKILLVDAEKKLGEMVATALAGVVTKDQLSELTADLITKDQWNQALEGMFSTPVPLTGLRPEMVPEEVPPIPEVLLRGLVFRTSRQKKTENGKVNVPVERALTAADVLSWRDNGDTVIIIAADGQKHTVEKE